MNISFTNIPIDRKIRIGVVGLGGASQIYHLPLIKEMDELELVGISDLEQYKLGLLSRKYNVPGFVDIENLLKQTSPDVILIATPPISHLPLSLTALAAGAHVIVEKPVTRNYSEANRLYKASIKNNRHVFVAMKHRFRTDVTVLRNFLNAEELGNVWRVRAGWSKKTSNWSRVPWLDNEKITGGGVLMDLGIEMLDLVHWMLGTPPIKRVCACMHHEALRRNVEDTITASIVYENGVTFMLDCSWGLFSESDVSYAYFEGTSGSAQLNPLTVFKTIQGELVNVSPVKSSDPLGLLKASFEAQLFHFAKVLHGEESPKSTIEDSRETMKVVDYIYTSAREGREFRPDEESKH
ncbi:Gfo/Idh/MocA family oxidoreductase [bacterium]|nr:Gfo/Idh/MocA family oxidoreductase [bacterium]